MLVIDFCVEKVDSRQPNYILRQQKNISVDGHHEPGYLMGYYVAYGYYAITQKANLTVLESKKKQNDWLTTHVQDFCHPFYNSC